METKIKHLDMILAIVNRMASSSFLIKGWAVTLISALFALAASGSNKNYVLISYFVLPTFWFLDGYYLHQERCFRSLFNEVRNKNIADIDFNMDCRGHNFGHNTWLNSLFSRVQLIFYGAALLATLIVMCLVK